MSATEEFEITIPNNTAAGQEIQERILSMLEDRDFTARDLFGVRLSLEEALVNAIKHGNQMNPDKSVKVFCRMTADSVYIEIEDEGSGFVPAEVPDPTADENLEKPSGRGIMLMRSLMNRIEYIEPGNKVVLEKQKQSEVD